LKTPCGLATGKTLAIHLRYNGKTGKWSLYCADRNSKWHEYHGLEPTQNFDIILNEIDKDPTGIFWG